MMLGLEEQPTLWSALRSLSNSFAHWHTEENMLRSVVTSPCNDQSWQAWWYTMGALKQSPRLARGGLAEMLFAGA